MKKYELQDTMVNVVRGINNCAQRLFTQDEWVEILKALQKQVIRKSIKKECLHPYESYCDICERSIDCDLGVKCPSCGDDITDVDCNYCPNCGQMVEKEENKK